MKKLAVFIIAATVFLSACAPEPKEPPQAELGIPEFKTGEYTNLADSDTQATVRDALILGGIDASYADGVMAMVVEYNEAMADCEVFRISGGFNTMTDAWVDYGTEEEYSIVSRHWRDTAQKEYGDVLCRSVAFYLLQDRIDASHPLSREAWDISEETGWLVTDWNGIETNPKLAFTEDKISAYFTLYHPVDIAANSDTEEMYTAITDAWQTRGVSFKEGEAKLITIWKEYEGRIAVAHAGVIVPYREGFLLFEKTNPVYPYQATFFSALTQVKQYMIDSLAAAYGSVENLGAVAVLADNQLL